MLKKWKISWGAMLLIPLVLAGTTGVLTGATAHSATLEKPTGAVILTIGGEIAQTNRPAFSKSTDLFLKFHDITFKRAAEFDRTMLQALGIHDITLPLSVDGLPPTVHLRGPRLKDVLAAAGGAGKTLHVMALDGFSVEITAADLEAHDWFFVLERDGRPLSIGKTGPAWIVYASPDGKALTKEDESRWPWAVFYIAVGED